jgi:hypothetical protein
MCPECKEGMCEASDEEKSDLNWKASNPEDRYWY